MKKYLNKFNIKYSIALIAILIFAVGCEEESNLRDGIRAVTFKPTANATLINEGSSITYTDESTDVSSRLWSFEGGSIANSDQQIVDVTYDTAGEYGTELEVISSDGSVQSNIFNVEVFPRVTSSYNASANAALFGSEITFTNTSENTVSAFENFDEEIEDDNFLWEFEGGIPATSTEANPVVTYPNTGVFDVKLTVYRRAPQDVAVTVASDFITIVATQVISPNMVRLAELGSKIFITYDVPVGPVDANAYAVTVDGADSPITSVEPHPTDPNTLAITLTTPVVDDQTISLSYTGSDFVPSGELLGVINNLSVENTVVNILGNRNPSFEDDATGGFPSNWGNWNGSANNPQDYAVVDTEQHTGNQSLQINFDGTTGEYILTTNGYDAVEEGEYRMSIWMKSSLDGVELDFRSIAEGWAHNSSSPGETLTTEWQQYSFDFSTVGNTALARNYWHVLRPVNYPAGVVVHMDDVALYRID